MKHSAKRLLSLLLALAMVLSLVPAVSAAAEYDIEILCPDKYTRAQSGYKYGEVIKTSYYSTTCKRNKNVNIQLPAGYDESKSYPVLYLLHGVMGSENDMLNYGTTIQNMVADGIAEEMIIVYPNMFSSATSANPSGFNEATMAGYDNFVNDLVNDLMPFVKETCNVKEGKENTAVAGFSMGGREALTIGLFRPDLFGYIGGFAPAPGIVPAKDSFMTHPGTFKEEEVKYEDEAPFLIMICSGDRDSVVGTFPKSYHELYTKNGIDHQWWEIPGSDHGDPATSSGVYNFCKYAFKEQVEAHEHEYESVVTDPTCTKKGFTTYTCTICGRSYTGDETAALGHDYQDGTCTRCGKLQPVPGSLANVDFTDPASVEQFEILNQASTEIREGDGLYMVTTTDAFEPCNGQISTFNPKDVVLVDVEGDWTATLKFRFDPSGAQNGYYQFFGFYAAEGDDYQNLAGIRGGDGAMQDFLRVDGTVTAETMNSQPGLSSAGTYWYRIVKEDTSYTCLRSADGEEFSEMFSFADTGIEADSIIIDAYTGMTQGYAFTVESLSFETDDEPMPPPPCEHSYEAVVTDPTCDEGGYTTYTCSKCGDSYVADETAKLGHKYKDGICTVCGEKDPNYVPDEPAEGEYVLADSIEAGKSYVLVADGQYALNNTAVTYGSYGNGTDTLGSTPVTIEGDKIVGEVDKSLLWTIELGEDVPASPIYDEVQYFLYDCDGNQLMRRSGSSGTAPLQAGGTYSRIHYVTISFYERADGSYTVFFNTDRTDDYPFSFSGSASGFNAPGTAQDSWTPETYGSSIRLYELAEGGDDPVCEHEYEEKVLAGPPSCDTFGVVRYTCTKCGHSYEVEYAPLGHDYEEVVTKPTCTEKGYTTYTCSVCGDSYKADYVDVIPHDYKDGVCTVCGAKEDKPQPECPSAIFSDVPDKDHWAHEGIDYAVANDLMNGVGDNKFNPGGTLTRAQLVTILYRVEKTPAVEYKATFDDVDDDIWYTDAIEWAAANKIVNGVGDGTNFAPDQTITREQIATILYRYDVFKNGEAKVEGDLKAFPDSSEVSTYAATAMIWANRNGIINGVTVNNVTKLAPKASATREQIASIMMRYLEAE